MVTVYQTGSLAASLRLTAISFAHGGVIYHGLEWTVSQLDSQEKPTEYINNSDASVAQFDLKKGTFLIEVTHEDDTFNLGTVSLEQNTLTDCVFILKNSDFFNEEAEYFAESDAVIDNKRRQDDRNVESRFGNIETPLKNPFKEQGQGIQLQSHPLLANEAQFDGMPPEINADPQKNDAAMEKQLQLQLQLQQQNQNNHAPPTAAPPGM